jgi:3-deoxy-D-manno-octulosonate 8-phosphate phosphatase (KDO 8-P phosphatase)
MDEVKAHTIKMLVMDVDGTLTDGKIYLGENGELMKAFDIKDGYAIHDLLPENGIIPAIITGRISKIVENRAEELGVKLVFQGIKDKLVLLNNLAIENKITLEEVAYIGDDLNDMNCIMACGFSGCPADAAEDVKKNVNYISTKRGGEGAVRDFVEFVIRRNI